MNKEYLEKIEVSAINLQVSVSELVNEIIRLQNHLRRSNELLSEGLSIVQDYSPGHDVFISEALQHLGLEE